ncbi:7-carboxy-7-deazaguanine synthase QueE [Streptomyces somaliensis]|uniref:7-carboxy-7-deazaguanine synthase QueE n=1 Tax=Streptomyces somaliensis TaxID=78355 RepID=UPI0020CF122B|nr:radical SAM protein [Streptomyces somaliensis]MCP9945315.1 7-carboxy-7-deazaguanine synthase QueE [Streptomyces somaliensis]MCP9961481.1 7-carboxy-7-deazaguanine synthase QueE [Streptomyces somaliensis]MCP9974288.1 7-carboxy-7-deazaguanine synthase QueE [Streptomyces somaliensis]
MPADTSAARKIVVNEIFGPTVQGEGPSMGRSCAFVRLGGCNLTCAWCDTAYTWDWTGKSNDGTAYDPKTELHAMDVEDVVTRLLTMGVELVVVSGGEPLQQQETLTRLCRALAGHGMAVEIETNGTITPQASLVETGVRFNVSPKLRHSGVTSDAAIRPESLRALAGTAGVAFKFVCRDRGDVAEVGAIVDQYQLGPVWIMPEGQDHEAVSQHLALIADAVVERRWNLSTRIHVQAWGKRRGV